MQAAPAFIASLCLLLSGCGSSISTVQSTAAPLDLSGNWQIESVPSPNPGILLLGNLKSSGTVVTGTFRFSNLAQPTTCGLDQVISLSGSADAAHNLTLTSQPLPNGTVISLQLVIQSSLISHGTGTISVSGTTCSFAASPAIGDQFASVTGTFAGPLTPGTMLVPAAGTPGTATLQLTDSTVPAADGQFPVTGILSYTLGTCTGSLNLTGYTSGVGVTLAYISPIQTTPTSPNIFSFLGTVPSTTAQITITFSLNPAPCSATLLSSASYTGTLTRQ